MKPKPGTKPKRVKLLFLHGFASSPRELRQLGLAMARDGYEVLAPLLPGHGENIQGMSSCQTEDWLDAVRFCFNALRKTDSPVAIVGHCLGGSLALAAARELNPQAVVCLATPFQALKLDFFSEIPQTQPKLLSTEALVADCRSPLGAQWRNKSCHSFVTENFLLSYKRAIEMSLSSLPKLRCPLAVALAGKANFTSIDAATRCLTANAPSTTQVIRLPLAGHAVCLDRGRGILLKGVRDFLNSIEPDKNLSF